MTESITEFLCYVLITFARIDQMKVGGKALLNPLRFRKDLFKPRRKRAGHGDSLIRGWITHGKR